MQAITFPLWDAPDFGLPRADRVSTHWAQDRLISVTLGRSPDARDDDPAALTITSMDASLTGSRQGLTLGPLLNLVGRLAETLDISAAEAAEQLAGLSEQPGEPATLIVGDRTVRSRRHDVAATGDWTVTTVEPGTAVCVAGGPQVAVPRLVSADMALWSAPLTEQVAQQTAS
ncbi:hypothetical protein [Actinoplanes sp. URMC 104]|uniref:hypothetical protein n=1 Tax=Actinoplanes sp. URMC 104 TaxID=3423409 RepID=UPI003F1D9F3F